MKRLVWMGLLVGAGVVFWLVKREPQRMHSETGASAKASAEAAANTASLVAARILTSAPDEPAVAQAEDAPHRSKKQTGATLTGVVVLGEGVVLAPGEGLEQEVHYRPEPRLVERTDARGEPLAPLETFGGGGSTPLLPGDRFRFDDIPTGIGFELWAGTEFATAVLQCPPLVPGEMRAVELVLTREARIVEASEQPFRLIAGRVVDEAGEPVAGIQVLSEPLDRSLAGDHWRGDQTDPEGRFILDALLGVPTLVRAEVMTGRSRRSFALGDCREVDPSLRDIRDLLLLVQRGVELQATVLWPDGASVASFGATLGGVPARGEAGELRIAHVPPEPAELWIHAEEGARVGWLRTRVQPGKSAHFVLNAAKLCELEVHAEDPDGKPLRFSAWAEHLDEPRLSDRATSSQLETPGSKRLTLPAGRVRIIVHAGLHQSEERILDLDRSMRAEFVLQPAGYVRGIVLDPQGKPVPRATVDCGSFAVDADGEGRFVARPADPTQPLIAWKEGHAHSEPIHLTVAPGAVVEGVVLRLRESCSLEGRLDDLRHEWTDLSLDAGGHVQTIQAQKGFFSLSDLPPGPGSVAVLHDDGSTGPRVEFTLRPDRTTRVEVLVR